MTPLSPTLVRTFLLNSLADSLEAKGLSPRDVPDDFDLLLEGVIDSFGIVDLISAIEEHFQIAVDLDDLDAESFTLVGPLSDYIGMRGAAEVPPQAE